MTKVYPAFSSFRRRSFHSDRRMTSSRCLETTLLYLSRKGKSPNMIGPSGSKRSCWGLKRRSCSSPESPQLRTSCRKPELERNGSWLCFGRSSHGKHVPLTPNPWPDSNRRARLCRPLPGLSVTGAQAGAGKANGEEVTSRHPRHHNRILTFPIDKSSASASNKYTLGSTQCPSDEATIAYSSICRCSSWRADDSV